MAKRVCSGCDTTKELNAENFHRDNQEADGFKHKCKLCLNAKRKRKRHQNKIKNTNTAAVHRQIYTPEMGQVADLLHDFAENPDQSTEDLANYVANLTTQERQHVDQKRARTVSLSHARDMLFLRAAEEMVERSLKGKIVPKGYATGKKVKTKRIVNLLLSDLHIGARIDPDEVTPGFGWVQQSRRLAHIVRETIDYENHHRAEQHLNIHLGGDVIEGFLGHDQADGEPLAEQSAAFWQYLGGAIGLLSAAYPSVTVYCQTGNHGRNRLRHEGRATTQKWDSFETMMYLGLRAMCQNLENVAFEIPKAPVCIVDLINRKMLLTHGDTHLRIGNPDTRADTYEAAMNRMNGTQEYGCHIDLLAIGHWHKPRILRFSDCAVIINGALVPSNGWAKTQGYTTACGQWIWESTERKALRRAEFIDVGPDQDEDESLDQMIRPFEGW